VDKQLDVLQGTLDMLILKAVSLGPLHGYGILLRIQQISKDRLEIQQGSLYPALYRLEHQGWITSEWGESENNRKAKYYRLTAAGKAQAAKRSRKVEPHGRGHRWNPAHDTRGSMTLLSRFRSWLRAIVRRSRMESEMDTELRFHIEAFAEDLVRSGVPREEALWRARIEFGGWNAPRKSAATPAGRTSSKASSKICALACACCARIPASLLLPSSPSPLGIAVNTAVFTAFDALVLRPRPVKDPDSLVAVFRTTPGDARGRFSYPDYVYFRDHSKSFSDLSLFAFGMALTSSDLPPAGPEARSRLTGAVGFQLPQLLQGGAQPIGCYFVSGNYFQMLGAVPLRGRLLVPCGR